MNGRIGLMNHCGNARIHRKSMIDGLNSCVGYSLKVPVYWSLTSSVKYVEIINS
jgi:hypothetical protein